MRKYASTQLFRFKLFILACLEIAHATVFAFMARQGMILGANTLTGLIPTLYEALDIVSRELVGFIPAVSRDSKADRVAKDQTVTVPIVGAATAYDITPGVTAPDSGDQNVGNTTLTISKSRMVPVRWTGDEQLGLASGGIFPSIQAQRFAQAMRTLTNEVEADLAGLHIYGSRAYGTYNSTPFGTAGDLSDNAQMLKILEDNGAPGDLHAVLGSAAIANIRGKQSVLFKVNEAGTDQLLRKGIIGEMQGAMVHNSAGILRPAAGTSANTSTDATGYAIGSTTITLDASTPSGTGTIIAGDIVTFAGDTNKYVVKTGDADTSNGGTIVLQEPGLRVAIPAAETAITVTAQTTRNMYFPRSAIALATRAPALPTEGDSADDVMEVTDPVSGLTFQVCLYRQYRQVHYEVGLAWGVKAIAPRHIGLLIG